MDVCVCVCVCVHACVCVGWFTFPALAHPGSPGQRSMHACFCASGLPEILWVKLHSPKQNTHTHTSLTALCPGIPGWARTRKVKTIWILLKQETMSGSGISWAICKSAPRSRQITMPAPHRSVFYRLDALPAAQPTVSKH